MSEAITVTAELQVKPGKEAEAAQLLFGLIEPTRSEPGCISYDLYAQQEKPGRYLFIELWQSREHLNSHLQQQHLQAFLKASHDLLAEPLHVSLWEKTTGP